MISVNRYYDRNDGRYVVDPSLTSNFNNINWEGNLQSMTVTDYPEIASLGQAVQSRALAPSSHSVCFLTMVRFADIDDPVESTICLVSKEGGYWYVSAYSSDDDNYAQCKASCLQW